MVKINIDVIGEHRSRDSIGRVLREAMTEQFGAMPWDMTVSYHQATGFRPDGEARYVNEGRPGQ